MTLQNIFNPIPPCSLSSPLMRFIHKTKEFQIILLVIFFLKQMSLNFLEIPNKIGIHHIIINDNSMQNHLFV